MNYLIGDVSIELTRAFFHADKFTLLQLHALVDDCLVKFNETIKEKEWFINIVKKSSSSYGTYFAIDDQNNLIVKYDDVGRVQLSVIWHIFDRMFHGMPDIMKLFDVYINKKKVEDLTQHVIDGNHINLFKLLLNNPPDTPIQWNTFQIKSSLMRCLINEKSQETSPK